jgi:hypothetical protein
MLARKPVPVPGLAALLLRWLALLLLLGLAAVAAQAGRHCEAQAPTQLAIEQGLSLAVETERALDRSGAQVLLLARAGQDLSRYRLRWSHMGFAYRASPDAPWRVLHKLNHCASSDAALYREGLAEFFLDSPHRYEAAVLGLSPEAQAALLPRLQDEAWLMATHEPRYSMLAYPWATRYQQSNQWLIEVLARALQPSLRTRADAQAWLQGQGYRPSVITLGALTRLGARMTQANIAFDDHPNDKRFADRIETVTVDSVFAWLRPRAGPPRLVQLD